MSRPTKSEPNEVFRIQIMPEWRYLLEHLVETGEASNAADMAREFIKAGILKTYGANRISEAIEIIKKDKSSNSASTTVTEGLRRAKASDTEL